MKLIAFYLPQFYEFEENNQWWGKGFTEWTNVKKAKPLFNNHYQPHPYKNNYYTLDSIEAFQQQIQWAKEFGIYGFCFYHYWMGFGKLLMEKPLEMFRDNKQLDIPYCLSWANHNWARSWVGGDKEILMQQQYGDESEWRAHYEYLLTFFRDPRYIKIDGKVALLIYLPEEIPNRSQMLKKLKERAISDGLGGICYIGQGAGYAYKCAEQQDELSYCVQYEPNYTKMHNSKDEIMKSLLRNPGYVFNRISQNAKHKIGKVLGIPKFELTIHNYDAFWKQILGYKNVPKKMIPCAFTSFDNTPRRDVRGQVYYKSTPKKFEKYLTKLLIKARDVYKKDIVFINAWNEWGEGAVLEPDKKYEFGYLEAVKNALRKSNGNL